MARNPSEAHTTVLCRAAQPRGPAEAAEPWEPTLWSHRERLSPPPPDRPGWDSLTPPAPSFPRVQQYSVSSRGGSGTKLVNPVSSQCRLQTPHCHASVHPGPGNLESPRGLLRHTAGPAPRVVTQSVPEGTPVCLSSKFQGDAETTGPAGSAEQLCPLPP